MTVATVIFYSGVHPYTLKETYTAKSKEEKLDQRVFLFWYKPEYKKQITRLLEQKNQIELVSKLFYKEKRETQNSPKSGKPKPELQKET